MQRVRDECKGLHKKFPGLVPAMSSPVMLLHEAARICGWHRISDWPDTFKPEELARLQYPSAGTEANRKRNIFSGLVLNALRDKSLSHEEVFKKKESSGGDTVAGADPETILSNYLDKRKTNNSPGFLGGVMSDARVFVYCLTNTPLRPDAVSAWLGSVGEEPSEYVAAWIGTKGTTKAGRVTKNDEVGALLEGILAALEQYAASKGERLDRFAMPGQRGKDYEGEGTFFWLCAQLYPIVFSKSESSFERYIAGHCSFGKWSKYSDIYSNALPSVASELGIQVKKKTNKPLKRNA